MMEASEIAANAASGCFLPANTSAMSWYRFNLPQPGDPTTLAENSAEETQYNGVYPAHTLTTTYAYNSTNQVVKQNTPDGGTSAFWYDYLSRLVVSQNTKQLPGNNYSYTKYDSLGRITEVGQKNTAFSGLQDSVYLGAAIYSNFLNSGSNSQITQTLYDLQQAAGNGIPSGLVQNNLRKRVAASIYRELPTSTNINATYYSYDQGGNVNTLWQQVDGLGLKKLAYEYDLVSGKVNLLSYQHGQNDQFYYQYKYDAENRLTEAWSSTQAAVTPYGFGSQLTDPYRKLDASYEYYLHGPLARMELGDLGSKVQGTDYAYTLQGWLKGVNSTTLSPDRDMGSDGSGLHQTIGKDVYGYSLGYYTGDYKPISGLAASAFGLQYQAQSGDVTGQDLFNGNISNTTVAIGKFRNGDPVGYTYRYDQLNRLKDMRQSELSASATSWGNSTITDKFKETYSYDGNGNILSLLRNGTTEGGPLSMDNLIYGYNKDAQGKLINNKLRHVKDVVPSGNYAEDLDNQNDDNYSYDAIGNLTKDKQEGILNIDWTVYGKIKSIVKSNGQSISYSYDAAGNRVQKNIGGLSTFYLRDAQGNTLGLYNNQNSTTNWKEQHLYGSSRLGMWSPDINLSDNNAAIVWDTIGKKTYELSNHLGNVLATISDKRLQSGSLYEADVQSANDFYAFGMIQPGRAWSLSNKYRYGFNGKENDNEVKGEGNQQDYGFRIYDPRLGRFLSVDPLTSKYSELTPYQFASNTPIQAIDLDGLEMFLINGWDGLSHRTKDAKNADDLSKMKDYWRKNNPNFVPDMINYFSYKATDVHYFDGSQGGASHGSVVERYRRGYKLALELIKNKTIDFKQPITIFGHSQGGAEAAGMSQGILSYTDAFNRINTNKLKPMINVLLLAPDGAESFGVDKLVNSIQLTFGDDGVVTNNRAIVGNIDINFNPGNYEYSPFQSKSLMKGLKAHSAPVDDLHILISDLRRREATKLFRGGKDENK